MVNRKERQARAKSRVAKYSGIILWEMRKGLDGNEKSAMDAVKESFSSGDRMVAKLLKENPLEAHLIRRAAREVAKDIRDGLRQGREQ